MSEYKNGQARGPGTGVSTPTSPARNGAGHVEASIVTPLPRGQRDTAPTTTGRGRLMKMSAAQRINKGSEDPLNDTVTKIYVATDYFIIYTASGAAGDAGRLRYVLPDHYASARKLRTCLAPIAGQLAYVSDVIASMGGEPARLTGRSQYAVLRDRTLDLCARAMQLAFEGHDKTAQELLERAQKEVTNRRDSRNRMRYIFANMVSLLAILFVVFMDRGGFHLDGLSALFTGPTGDGRLPSETFRVVDVLAFGALGAFFGVSADINSVRVNHAISIWEMLYAGFVRVPIGVIAAAVAILLISGGWILASVDAQYQLWAFYLFGFLAGFSEMFVPNALKQVEGSGTVRLPGGGAATGSVPTTER